MLFYDQIEDFDEFINSEGYAEMQEELESLHTENEINEAMSKLRKMYGRGASRFIQTITEMHRRCYEADNEFIDWEEQRDEIEDKEYIEEKEKTLEELGKKVDPLKVILEVMSYKAEAIQMIAESASTLKCDPEDENSRAEYLYNVIKVGQIIEIITLYNDNDYYTVTLCVPIRKAFAELIDQLDVEDFIVLYQNKDVSDLFCAPEYFEVLKKKIQEMSMEQFLQIMPISFLETSHKELSDIKLTNLPKSIDECKTLAEIKYRRILDSNSKVLKDLCIGKSMRESLTLSTVSGLISKERMKELLLYYKKWMYIERLYTNSAFDNSKVWQQYKNSEGYRNYLKMLSELSTQEFIMVLHLCKKVGNYQVSNPEFFEEEKEILSNHIKKLTDVEIISVLIDFDVGMGRDMAYTLLEEEAYRRKLMYTVSIEPSRLSEDEVDFRYSHEKYKYDSGTQVIFNAPEEQIEQAKKYNEYYKSINAAYEPLYLGSTIGTEKFIDFENDFSDIEDLKVNIKAAKALNKYYASMYKKIYNALSQEEKASVNLLSPVSEEELIYALENPDEQRPQNVSDMIDVLKMRYGVYEDEESLLYMFEIDNDVVNYFINTFNNIQEQHKNALVCRINSMDIGKLLIWGLNNTRDSGLSNIVETCLKLKIRGKKLTDPSSPANRNTANTENPTSLANAGEVAAENQENEETSEGNRCEPEDR